VSLIKKHKPGTFCWADLGTTDVAGAKRFYKSLLGWTTVDFPMGPGDEKYTTGRVKGKDAGALYPMAAVQRKRKAQPAWIPYICVDSADATAKKAKAAGGKVRMAPMDVFDLGRQALIEDPTGATFAIWEPRKHKGAGLDDAPGTVAWHDLNTPKTKAAGKFYSKVFGWKTKDERNDKGVYYLFKLGRSSLCGMWPQPLPKLPPSWVTYWNVADCAKSIAKAKRLGGRVLLGMIEVPEMCRIAILKDPKGAPFGILQPLM
jgi:predicted enzyme related to lactoylglutathione lyase